MTKIEANKPVGGGGAKWTMDLGYASTRAISDVFTSVTMNGTLVYDYFYDAFGRRRMKRDPFNNGYEFTYDLGHQLLIDQTWVDTDGYGSSLDEYVWLDGRPVVAFRGAVNATGAHEIETLTSPPGSMGCWRPEEGDLHCGAFHLVSNQQNFVILALSDYDGKVASFALPDADGIINQARFVSFGGYTTSLTEAFDVPTSFSKDARFRTVYTGGWQTAWGWWPGVDELALTTPGGGAGGVYPYGAEYGRTWSPRVGPMTGTQNVTWSTVCSSNCASATDMLEWRVWESGAPRFNTRLRFPGQYHDAETDFYENWNRFYDPTTGRYLSPEPLLDDPNWVMSELQSGYQVPAYAYARNNPVTNVDPDGRFAGTLRFLLPRLLPPFLGGAAAGVAASQIQTPQMSLPAPGPGPESPEPPPPGPACQPGGGNRQNDCWRQAAKLRGQIVSSICGGMPKGSPQREECNRSAVQVVCDFLESCLGSRPQACFGNPSRMPPR